MKILKPGKIEPELWWLGKKYSCRKCGCKFQLEKGDHPNNDLIFTLPCPTCKQVLRMVKPIDQGLFRNTDELFNEVFGDGKLFEDLFGKYKK